MEVSISTFTGMLLLALLLATGTARAEEGGTVSVSAYLDYLDLVREGFVEGDPRQLTDREQRRFDSAHRDIERLLDGKESIDELRGTQRVALYNAQERINALLTGGEADQLVCRREAETGSRFRETRCVSAELRQRQTDAAQDLLRRFPAQKLGQY